MVVVNVMLSTTRPLPLPDEAMATCDRFSTGTISINEDNAFEISRSKPSSAIPSVKTNKPAKNRSESHSTFSNACSKSCSGPVNKIAIAPNNAAYDGENDHRVQKE